VAFGVPLKEIVAFCPKQIDGLADIVAVLDVEGTTEIFLKMLVAQGPPPPPLGVKLYVCVPTILVLINGGFQVPTIPFKEIDGKVGGVLPSQIGGIGSNIGITRGKTLI
jgi:hypothetical protein